MSQTPEPGSDSTKAGLIKVKEVVDAAHETDDPQLVAQAQHALHTQVSRLTRFASADIHWEAAKTREIPGTFRYVYSPTTAEPGNMSGVTVFFDQQGSHVNTVETLFSQPSAGAHRLQVWSNGKLVADQVFDEGQVRPQFSWDVLNSCLSNAGIAWATVALISVVCSAACVGTAGAGCVVCIAALAGDTGGTIGFCVGRAIAS